MKPRDANPLLGTWLLESWRIHHGDGRPPTTPFGELPAGVLIYGADGWMSAAVAAAVRPSFPEGSSPRSLPDRLLREACLSYFHYTGPYRIEGERVIHSVRCSLNPAMVGSEQVREMELREPRLTLRGTEITNHGTRRHELVWRRAPQD